MKRFIKPLKKKFSGKKLLTGAMALGLTALTVGGGVANTEEAHAASVVPLYWGEQYGYAQVVESAMGRGTTSVGAVATDGYTKGVSADGGYTWCIQWSHPANGETLRPADEFTTRENTGEGAQIANIIIGKHAGNKNDHPAIALAMHELFDDSVTKPGDPNTDAAGKIAWEYEKDNNTTAAFNNILNKANGMISEAKKYAGDYYMEPRVSFDGDIVDGATGVLEGLAVRSTGASGVDGTYVGDGSFMGTDLKLNLELSGPLKFEDGSQKKTVAPGTKPAVKIDGHGSYDVTISTNAALPSKTVTEIRNNRGYQNRMTHSAPVPVKFPVSSLGDVTPPEPEIGTTLMYEGTRDAIPGHGTHTLIDEVSYEDLNVGEEYVVTGKLMDKATGEGIVDGNGDPVTGSTTFTPTNTSGKVEVEFTVEAHLYAGKSLVAFESLTLDGREVAIHADINDEGQTLPVNDEPELGTTLFYEGERDAVPGFGQRELVDVVTYTNLIPGEEYTVTGQLMDKETGEVIQSGGAPIESEAIFTPENPEGEVEVVFVVDASTLAGKTTVAFESLEYEGREIATHADINDEDQTIPFDPEPKIGTTLLYEGERESIPGFNERTLVDVVAYENLEIGEEYTVHGVLMDKATEEPLLDEEGNEITSSATFTAEEQSGTVEIEFVVDADLFAGITTVAFETLQHDGKDIAIHADINDEDQTLPFDPSPGLKTTLMYEDARDPIPGHGVRTLVDVVDYSNLEVGKEYDVHGVLMDKETEEPLVDAEGNEITSSATFVPEEKNGSVELEFVVDAALYAGTETVAFETLYLDEKELAIHADINDVDQTLPFDPEPELKTVAVNTEDGEKVIEAKENASITDTVCDVNESLVPGTEYEIVTHLMFPDGSNVVNADGEPVEVVTKFTPETADECAEIVIEFDSRKLADEQEVIVFEEIFLDGESIAVHHDLEDKDQTVTISNPDNPEIVKIDSGNAYAGLLWAAVGGLGLIVLAVGGLIAYRRMNNA